MHYYFCHSSLNAKYSCGEGIRTAKFLRIYKAALIYKITINALLESKWFSYVMFYAHFNMVRHYICRYFTPSERCKISTNIMHTHVKMSMKHDDMGKLFLNLSITGHYQVRMKTFCHQILYFSVLYHNLNWRSILISLGNEK